MSTREVLNMINVSDEEITRQYNTILKKFLDDHNIYVLLNDDNLYNKYKIDSFVKSNKYLFVDANGDYYGNVTVPTGNHLYDDVYNMKNGEFLWGIPGL